MTTHVIDIMFWAICLLTQIPSSSLFVIIFKPYFAEEILSLVSYLITQWYKVEVCLLRDFGSEPETAPTGETLCSHPHGTTREHSCSVSCNEGYMPLEFHLFPIGSRGLRVVTNMLNWHGLSTWDRLEPRGKELAGRRTGFQSWETRRRLKKGNKTVFEFAVQTSEHLLMAMREGLDVS